MEGGVTHQNSYLHRNRNHNLNSFSTENNNDAKQMFYLKIS